MQTELRDVDLSRPMTRKQWLGGCLSVSVFFGYLAAATVFHSDPVVRMILIGPYGLSAGLWLGTGMSFLCWGAAREKRRLGLEADSGREGVGRRSTEIEAGL